MSGVRAPLPRACALAALLAVLAVAAVAGAEDILYNITEEEYYEMPQLFELDEWEGCLAARGAYCVGDFELAPAAQGHRLFTRMQRYSANWVDNFNHTQLHRAWCLSRRCAADQFYAGGGAEAAGHAPALEAWFAQCVNASTMSGYALSARLSRLQYCRRGPSAPEPPLSAAQRGFAALLVALLALAAGSTALDLALCDHSKKGLEWALSWSLPGCWRALQAAPARAPPPAAPGAPDGPADLRMLDGLRVMCVVCVLIEHVCWLATQGYVGNVWQYEQMRRDTDAMLMANSTLVVQIFFLMSSFLLAHKLLQQPAAPPGATFARTMLHRFIRVSPSYWVVVWFAASWWERLGAGPLWQPLVGAEAAVCRRKWWTHLLYLNNVLDADHKCLIQTWYLAADMQLYAAALVLTLALRRRRGGALCVLSALLLAAVLAPFALAYAWRLVPTFVMHRPELVRAIYSGESSFNVLYQSPLNNAAGTLAGLLMAHLHRELRARQVALRHNPVFRWLSVLGPLLAAWWAAAAPALLGRGPPARGAAAALAALERPVFSLFVALAMLGAMHGVRSPLRALLAWRGWAVPARLSFGVLLLHMPFNKALLGARLGPTQVNRQVAFVESFGVALVSFALALPLALLVELPAARLHKAIADKLRARAAPPPAAAAPQKAAM